MDQKTRLLESIDANWPEPRDTTEKMRWISSLPGGDINHAALIGDGVTSYFLKYHRHASTDMFAGKHEHSMKSQNTNASGCPNPFCVAVMDRLPGWLWSISNSQLVDLQHNWVNNWPPCIPSPMTAMGGPQTTLLEQPLNATVSTATGPNSGATAVYNRNSLLLKRPALVAG